MGLRWWQALWRYSTFEGADTAWSLIVLSTYFGTLLQVRFGGTAAEFGWTTTLAGLVIAFASPLLGAAADERGRRQPYLRLCVLGVVIATAAIGFAGSAGMALLAFATAYLFTNAGFTLFTGMLPAVGDQRSVAGLVSMTVGVGYACALISLFALSPLATGDSQAGRVFLPMAAIYGALATPVLFASPDFPARSARAIDVGAAYRRLRATFATARRHKELFKFLVGNFLYENAVASVVTLMGLYARNVMGFPASALKAIFGPAIVMSALSAWLVFGPLVRRVGPRKGVLIVLAIWLLTFLAALLVRPGATLAMGGTVIGTQALFAGMVAPLAGLGLAGVWSTSRVLLTALVPAGKAGEFWGLYALSGRTATLLGDATWSAILSLFGEGLLGYRIAILAMAFYVVAGGAIIWTLPDARPRAENFVAG